MQVISRALLLVVSSLIVSLIYSFGPGGGLSLPKPNEIAKETVIAPFTFDIIRNPEEVQREQNEARRRVLSVFDYDENASQRVYDRLNAIEDLVRPEARLPQRRPDSFPSGEISANAIRILRDSPQLLEEIRFCVDRLLDSGIASVLAVTNLEQVKAYKEKFHLVSVPYLFYDKDYVSFRKLGTETAVPVFGLLPREACIEKEMNRLEKIIANPERLGAVSEVLLHFLSPNVFYNPVETTLRREAEAAKVVTTRGRIVQGTKIAIRGQKLSAESAEALYSLQVARSNGGPAKRNVGEFLSRFLLAMLTFACLELLLRAFFPGLMGKGRELFAFLLVLLCCLALTRGMEIVLPEFGPGWDQHFLRPFLAAPAIAAVLWGIPAGLVMSIVVALCGILFSGLPDIMLPYVLLGGALAAWLYSRITRMRDYAFASAGLAAGLIVLYLAVQIAANETVTLRDSVSVAGGGFMAACLAALSRPFEVIGGVRSRASLAAFSNLSHPLVLRLSVEASGTFQHSLNVANMCAAAAESAGEDPSMCRIAGLYHDIGKILKPSLYWENQDPQVRLQEDEAARAALRSIVLSHVQDGVSLATDYRLPNAVVQSTLEHHGTNPVFDHAEPNSQTEQRAIHYPGPKPSTKISTIVMLADSLEMAVRSRGIQSAAERLVAGNSILRRMLLTGQLERSSLTLDELTRVIESMVLVLRGFQPGATQVSGK